MKQIFRRSQMKDVIGRSIGGMKMHKYGLPYRNAAGHIFPMDQDAVDLMLIAIENHPELHVVTHLNKTRDYQILNRYESEDARVHYLYTGNPDPEIVFTNEFRIDDWTEKELEAGQRWLNEVSKREYTPLEIAAVNFAVHVKIKLGD